MGLIGRFVERFGRAHAATSAAALEARGQLDAAYARYLAAGQGAEAARVMLAQAQAQPDARTRLASLALAVAVSPADSEVGRDARKRHALLALDLFRAAPDGMLSSERVALAQDLESAGMNPEAAEIYGVLGDIDNQSRVLAACGAIDALESALGQDELRRDRRRSREQAWHCAHDLDALGQRLAAIKQCETWLAGHANDEQFASFCRQIRDRLVRGNSLIVQLHGQLRTIALGAEVVIGRDECSICLRTPVLSRRHLVLCRDDAQRAVVQDPGSRNGTLLAGARIGGILAVGSGLDLSLAGQIACRVEPTDNGALLLRIADRTYLAPLGPLRVGPWQISGASDAIRVSTADDGSLILNGLTARPPIELAVGDELRAQHDGPVALKVMGA